MANPWQNLALFAGNQPLLPFPLPPVPAPQPSGPNWQDLASFAQPPAPSPRTAGKGSVQRIAPDRSFGPLGDLAQQHVDELRLGGQTPPDPGFTELLPMMPIGPPAAPVDAAVRGIGAMVSRFPRAATAAAGAGALTVDPSQAEPPDPLSVARDTIGKLRKSQADLQGEQERLMAERRQFDAVNPSDAAAVARAQQLVGVKPDGRWGEQTAKAIAGHRANVERQIGRLDGQLGRLTGDIETQEQRLTGLEGGERLRAAEADVGPVRRALREWGPMAGLAAGAALGHWTRGRAVSRAADESARAAARADALIVPRARTAQQRQANVNEFWRAGGADENVPFRPVQTARGFARRPNAAEPSELYPPGPTRYRGSDIGVAAAGVGEAGVSGGLWYLAHQEQEAAQSAVDKDPSTINIDRLQKARDMVAAAETLTRGGLGAAAGRLGGAWSHPYREVRPNVAAGEHELSLLNTLLARDAKKAKTTPKRK